VEDKLRFKVPHMGWNNAFSVKPHGILTNISNDSDFYFVHSFHFEANFDDDILMKTHYNYSFPSAIQKENIFGFQFHPEKSHDIGKQLLKNFIEL
jgi:glutamine amidotransferase